MGKKEQEIGLLYFCVQKKLLENSKQKLISKKYCVYILANQFHIPSALRYCILKEMENNKMIEHVNRQIIKINEVELDLENTSAIFEKVGLF